MICIICRFPMVVKILPLLPSLRFPVQNNELQSLRQFERDYSFKKMILVDVYTKKN